MKKIIALLFAAGLSLGVAHTPAKASNFDLGALSADTSGFVANFGSNITTFTDTIAFSLAGVSNALVGSIEDLNNIFGQVVDSFNFSLDLFKVGDDTTLGHYTDATGTGISFNYADLAAGDYFFRITGDSSPKGNAYNYHFNVKVTETPIPPALLLFGTALGGMGFAAYRKRKAAAQA
ncbi:hypothetical protein [Dongia rigui]|uniref:PEP-CTERM protein-sorting domain-containing protein n=1 Tax=Dongia rigui TaxID=940149 RepID=A0ABU5E166_9PROT|nr:hypothetical protein [Dongia rigui]MDY0872566.1 hypothetical protein [Dongia rigui]